MKKKVQTIEQLKNEGWVKTAAEIPIPNKETLLREATEVEITPEEIKSIFERMKWHKEIEAYCGEMGIFPTDLIETHRQSLKMAKKGTKEAKELKIQEKATHSNWFETYRGTKTGITKHKA